MILHKALTKKESEIVIDAMTLIISCCPDATEKFKNECYDLRKKLENED